MPLKESPYHARRSAVLRRVRLSGVTRSDIARAMGYESEGGFVYVRRVLNGQDTSAPLLDRIEAALDAMGAEVA